MSDTSDRFTRPVALEKAMDFYKDQRVHRDTLVETAELFRAFLAGETQKPPGVYVPVDSRPVFTLPKPGDGYVYFRFESDDPGWNIYYRALTAYGSDALGGVDRLSQGAGSKWEPTSSRTMPSVNTRRKLMQDDDYHVVGAEEVARNLRQTVTGHRFE
jgi:hypothetical protein